MTPKEVAVLSGVSVRALHHYDEIGLLVPKRNEGNSYREYSQQDIDRLQQILFFRECGFPLEEIKSILDDENYQPLNAFAVQREMLLTEKKRIEDMLATLDKTEQSMKGEYTMKNSEKFQVFKQELVEKNEEKYGEEIRNKYGEKAVEQSNAHLLGMSEAEYNRGVALDEKIVQLLKEQGDKRVIATLHKDWLILMWGNAVQYSREAHLQLATGYIEDERFADHYGGIENVQYLYSALSQHL